MKLVLLAATATALVLKGSDKVLTTPSDCASDEFFRSSEKECEKKKPQGYECGFYPESERPHVCMAGLSCKQVSASTNKMGAGLTCSPGESPADSAGQGCTADHDCSDPVTCVSDVCCEQPCGMVTVKAGATASVKAVASTSAAASATEGASATESATAEATVEASATAEKTATADATVEETAVAGPEDKALADMAAPQEGTAEASASAEETASGEATVEASAEETAEVEASADATVDASTDASAEATVDGLSQGMRKLSVRPLSALLLWRRKSRGSKAAEEPVEGQPVGPKATRGVPITIAQTVARPGAAEAGARKA